MRRVIILLCAFPILLLTGFSLPNKAGSLPRPPIVNHISFTVPAADAIGTIHSFCTNEDVVIDGGNIHFTGVVVITGNNVMFNGNVNNAGIHGVGVNSGLNYNYTGTLHFSNKGSLQNGNYISFSRGRFAVNPQGGNMPNQVSNSVFRMVVNANGQLVSFDFDGSFECQ